MFVDSKQSIIEKPDTLNDLYSKAFYGFKYNIENGNFSIEFIKENEPIKIPVSSNFLGSYEYFTWLSSTKKLSFNWNDNDQHLYLEVI
jgi:hypothetical protein